MVAVVTASEPAVSLLRAAAQVPVYNGKGFRLKRAQER